MICKIADFIVEFKNPSNTIVSYLKNYVSEGAPDFCLEATEQEIETVRSLSKVSINKAQAEMTVFHTKLLSLLPQKDAMFLHASLIEVKGMGVAFTALSGTGKSTHTLLWKKLLGDKMRIINGDKPIIRFLDGIPFGYGNPWNGKEGLGINAKTPLKHICFIERSSLNRCQKITSEQALKKIFDQIFIPRDPLNASNTLSLLNRLLTQCTIWNIECNTDIGAAETAYRAIFEENCNET